MVSGKMTEKVSHCRVVSLYHCEVREKVGKIIIVCPFIVAAFRPFDEAIHELVDGEC